MIQQTGEEGQMAKSIEEVVELHQALIQYQKGHTEERKLELLGEIADVGTMLMNLQIIFSLDIDPIELELYIDRSVENNLTGRHMGYCKALSSFCTSMYNYLGTAQDELVDPAPMRAEIESLAFTLKNIVSNFDPEELLEVRRLKAIKFSGYLETENG